MPYVRCRYHDRSVDDRFPRGDPDLNDLADVIRAIVDKVSSEVTSLRSHEHGLTPLLCAQRIDYTTVRLGPDNASATRSYVEFVRATIEERVRELIQRPGYLTVYRDLLFERSSCRDYMAIWNYPDW